MSADLRAALIANAVAHDGWNDITPPARSEFIGLDDDAKQDATRERRIRRTQRSRKQVSALMLLARGTVKAP